MLKIFNILLAACLLLCSCSGKKVEPIDGDTITNHAQWLTLVDCGDYVVADVFNPWATDRSLLERYVLAPHSYHGPLPDNAIVIRTPISRSAVSSGAYAGIIDELGATDRIAGVTDPQYMIHGTIRNRVAQGSIIDVGREANPSIERIIDIDADALIMSAYPNQGFDQIEQLGIPVLKMVDYMESTPQGRAEWIKLLGCLYGKRTESFDSFSHTVARYDSLSSSVASARHKPVVITDMPISGSWDLPAGDSYMARIIADAGGNYLYRDTHGVGSIKRDIAAVIDRGDDIDCWIIRSYGPLDRKAIADLVPLNRHIRAFAQGNLWVCNTARTPLFDQVSFHPEYLLESLIAILHPHIADTPNRYFTNCRE